VGQALPLRLDDRSFEERFDMTDAYVTQLDNIVSVLSQAGLSSSVRGEDTARFVHAEHGGRAVEVSHDGVGFFVELFEKPADVSVRDYQQDTLQQAIEQATDWLLRRDMV
jgi:hypothetical protein